MPTAQGTHAVEPGSAQLPGAQHTVVASALRVPLSAQGAQEVALKVGPTVSAMQGAQAIAPVPASRSHAVPRGQGKHPGAGPPTNPDGQQLAHPGEEKSPPPAHAAQEAA